MRARFPQRELPRFAPYLIADADAPPAEAHEPVIELPIARLREDARMPERAYSGDAGLDLSTCERVRLGPGRASASSRTGLAVAIPEGFAGFVQPRSGLAARHGIAVVNSPGLIDSGYRGEIRSSSSTPTGRETFVAEPGDRIAQLVVLPVPELELRRARRAARERAGRARLRLVAHLTWSRASVCPPSCGARTDVLLVRHEKPGTRVLAAARAAASTVGRRSSTP